MTDNATPWIEAKRKGRPHYIGAVCKACGFRKRYTSTRNCVACRKQRTLDLDDDRPARLVERKAARARQQAGRNRAKRGALVEQPATLLEMALSTLIERISEHGNRNR